jgi:arylformamidase
MEIKKGMLVYPGNPKVKLECMQRIPKHSTNVSRLVMGTHTGTHADSLLHVKNKGWSIEGIPLDRFYGKCRVLDCTRVPFGKGIEAKHLKNKKITKGDIVLLKTKNSFTGFKKFRKDFVYLSEEGARFLAKKKVKTVGIDYLGIQKYHTGYCAAHCILMEKEIVVFEGLDLSKVGAGRNTFAGFPLKIKKGNGAPARAVLMEP